MNKPYCYFCGEENNIIVTSLHHENEEGKLVAPICHVCFNRGADCRDPLVFEGLEITFERPRIIYGRDWELKEWNHHKNII